MNPRRLTDEQEKALAEGYTRGATMATLAVQWKCSESTVKNALKRQGVPLRSRHDVAQTQMHLTVLEEGSLATDYLNGMSLEGVADKYGCSVGTARNVLLRRGVPRRPVGRKPNPVSALKHCSSCGYPKPRTDFYTDGRRTSECKDCTSAKQTDKYHTDPHYRKERLDAERRRKRGWSSGFFDQMWEVQEGRCAICRIVMERKGCSNRSVAADHDHVTGKTRALLCASCNKGLGNFRDSPEFLLAAVDYLRAHT